MKKILDLLIIFLLTFWIINIFTHKEPENDNKLTFETSSKDYTVPASVLLNINNNTANEVKLNTCKDIIITNSTV
jgi:hypothetical protein